MSPRARRLARQLEQAIEDGDTRRVVELVEQYAPRRDDLAVVAAVAAGLTRRSTLPEVWGTAPERVA